MDDTNGPQQWYDSMPFITKHWLTLAAATTIMTNFEVIPIMKLFWSWKDVSQNFEIWRLFSCFLWLGPFKFNTVIDMFLLYTYSKQYEGGVVYNTGGGGGTADYAYMLILGMVSILITGSLFGLGVFFGNSLIFYVLYVWSKRNPTVQAAIWGIPIQGMYLPFALVGLNTLLGNSVMYMIHGIAAGHLYYFLVDVVPKVYGKDLIQTPLFFIQKFGIGEYVPPAPRAGMDAVGSNTYRPPGNVNPPRDPAASTSFGGGHNWGTGGQRLGRE